MICTSHVMSLPSVGCIVLQGSPGLVHVKKPSKSIFKIQCLLV